MAVAPSVVIPARNEAHNIGLLLADLMAQEHPAGEIIVVDTGSTDGTQSQVRAVASRDARVRLVELGSGFPGAGRNAGMRAATGDWVAFVDSGMRVDRHWLRHLCAEVERDPSVDWVLGGLEVPTGTREQRAAALAYVPHRRATPQGGGQWRGYCLPSSLLRRQLALQAGGLPEDLRSGEDVVFWHRLRDRVRFAYAPLAKVTWSHAHRPVAIWRRFRTYAEHSFRAGLHDDWFDVLARRYLALLAGTGPVFPAAATGFLLLRSALMQRRKPEFVDPRLTGRLRQLIEVAYLLGIIDAATVAAWIAWRRQGRPRIDLADVR